MGPMTSGIKRWIRATHGIEVQYVSCPVGLRLRKSASFTGLHAASSTCSSALNLMAAIRAYIPRTQSCRHIKSCSPAVCRIPGACPDPKVLCWHGLFCSSCRASYMCCIGMWSQHHYRSTCILRSYVRNCKRYKLASGRRSW